MCAINSLPAGNGESMAGLSERAGQLAAKRAEQKAAVKVAPERQSPFTRSVQTANQNGERLFNSQADANSALSNAGQEAVSINPKGDAAEIALWQVMEGMSGADLLNPIKARQVLSAIYSKKIE